jgi:hypothetical protein
MVNDPAAGFNALRIRYHLDRAEELRTVPTGSADLACAVLSLHTFTISRPLSLKRIGSFVPVELSSACNRIPGRTIRRRPGA